MALCTYNGDQYLRNQLESIATQTLPPDELIVRDDHSSDATLEIVTDFASKAPFPVLISQNSQNLGSTKNFEAAIDDCSADFIALSDQDDVWLPQKLEILREALGARPDAGYAFSDAWLVTEDLKQIKRRLWDVLGIGALLRRNFAPDDQFGVLLTRYIVTGATMMIRASDRSLILPIPTGWLHDAWIAAILSFSRRPGVAVPHCLLLYRQHRAQQIGVRRQSLTSILRRAFLSEDGSHAAENWSDFRQRVRHPNFSGRVDSSHQALLDEKVSHLYARSRARALVGLPRLQLVVREIVRGRYARTSGGWRSALKDLLHR